MAFALGCEDIKLEYAVKTLFDGVTLGIDEGDRIGIVGRNGDGKSSLLRILAQLIEPDSGRVFKRNDFTIGFLAQDDAFDDDDTIASAIFGSAPEYTWAADPRIRDILDHLIGTTPFDSRIKTLSGGERRRVDLARVLVDTDEILMLDEPTNHLDIMTISWLASHLNSRWPSKTGTLLVVTHDRWFLDEVCTSMWEVHDGTVEPFTGGYSSYVLQRVEREEAARVAEAKRQNLLRRELAWLSRGARARATKPKFHVEAAEALIADVPPIRDTLELKRAAVARLGKQAVDLVNVSKSFEGRRVLDNVSWIIAPGDRVGILGDNGVGKTTLLKLIEGKLEPDQGHVKIGKTVKIAVLSQRLEELDGLGDYEVREVLTRYRSHYMIDGKELTSRQLLERLGFKRAHFQLPVSHLSGGQKRRLQLMLTLLEGANVLILDEPGNDMDVDMLAQIESILDTWPGTLVLVTHDRHLMERVTDNQYALVNGTVRHLPGGIDEYLRQASIPATVANRSGGPAMESKARFAKDAPGLTNAQRQAARKKIASAERKLETARKRLADAEQALRDADATDYQELIRCEEQVSIMKTRLEELEDEWLELSEALEG